MGLLGALTASVGLVLSADGSICGSFAFEFSDVSPLGDSTFSEFSGLCSSRLDSVFVVLFGSFLVAFSLIMVPVVKSKILSVDMTKISLVLFDMFASFSFRLMLI